MKKLLILMLGAALMFNSCELLNLTEDGELSGSEIIEGLKTALNVGTDSASTTLAQQNGYFGDPLVKIPLPDEAEYVREIINSNSTLAGISSIIGLEDLFKNVIKSVNYAAEDAASEAAPVFKEAITNLTIEQGWDILHGTVPGESKSTKNAGFDSTAATKYLSQKTFDPLTSLYAPKINASLDKKIVGTISAVEAWDALTSKYNSFLGRSDVKMAIQLANALGQSINLPESINTNLGEFSTQKALNGLFLKVGEEEIKIRRDPWQWVSTTVGNILTKVFGSVE
ncbi:MAG: DUF4197 domain-containing protein [Bacteroidales bacterium]|nr:DUF4197 domain-containing protein [Bacteroidales bacterium]